MALLTYRCNFKLSHGFTICNLFSFPPVPKLPKKLKKAPQKDMEENVWVDGGGWGDGNTSRVS